MVVNLLIILLCTIINWEVRCLFLIIKTDWTDKINVFSEYWGKCCRKKSTMITIYTHIHRLNQVSCKGHSIISHILPKETGVIHRMHVGPSLLILTITLMCMEEIVLHGPNERESSKFTCIYVWEQVFLVARP